MKRHIQHLCESIEPGGGWGAARATDIGACGEYAWNGTECGSMERWDCDFVQIRRLFSLFMALLQPYVAIGVWQGGKLPTDSTLLGQGGMAVGSAPWGAWGIGAWVAGRGGEGGVEDHRQFDACRTFQISCIYSYMADLTPIRKTPAAQYG